jgi:DNA primase
MQKIDLDRLREETPIIELAERLGLEVRRKQARCFNAEAHKNGDKKPSLGFDTRTNRFKCFACGVSGSVLDLYMAVRGVDLPTAIKELGNGYATTTYEYKPAPPKPKKIAGDYSEIYETLALTCELDKEATDYLTGDKRGLSKDTVNMFGVFSIGDYNKANKYLKDNFDIKALKEAGLFSEKDNLIFYKHKVVIPFYYGDKIVFLHARNIDGTHPKYLNLIDIPKPIFNLEKLSRLDKGDKVYICEGVFDAMRLTQAGYTAVAILGVTDFKADEVEAFKPFKVVLALDNDEAGKEMTQQIAKMFLLNGKAVSIKELPEGIKDITDFFLQGTGDFEDLPEKEVEVKGLPKTTIEDLPDYYKTLGNGTRTLIGIETGIDALDKATMGLSGIVVLGGIAGLGKTSLALQIAFETCEKGTPVIFYSLEMPKRAIYTKILNRLSKVGYGDIMLKGKPYLDPEAQDTDLMGNKVDFHSLFSKDEAEALGEARTRLMGIGDRLYIRSRERGEEAINFSTLQEEINLVKVKHNTDKVLVVIDHLQVFDFRKDEKERASDQIDKESKLIDRFKELSEKTDTPILLISQKNKQGFGSSGLESIKGSVDIVYLADIVMTLEGEDNDTTLSGLKRIKLVINKNRYNSPTALAFNFNGTTSNFETAIS